VRPGLDQYLYAPVRSVDDLYEQLSHTRIPIYTPEAVAEKTRLVAGRKWKQVPSPTKRKVSAVLAAGLIGFRKGSKRALLGSSAKVEKGGKKTVLTAQMFLSPPGDQSGVDLCPLSGACEKICIIETGNLATNKEGRPARIGKTLWFWLFRAQFLAALDKQIRAFVKRAKKEGKKPALRLNGTSDVLWETYGVPQRHPDVQMYDYTKLPVNARRNRPPNYHLTYSFSEDKKSMKMAREWLAAGGNVAVVVAAVGNDTLKAAKQASKAVSHRETWEGYPTLAADEDDIRFWDPKGHWAVLYAKGPALRDRSGFVVRVNPNTGARSGRSLLGLANRKGRAARGRHSHDQYTGEPLPPYQGRGRPRSYNSKATKFAAVRQGEWSDSVANLEKTHGPIWTADKLTGLLTDLSLMRNNFNSTAVCDGGLRFQGEPQLFDQKKGKKLKPNPRRGRDIYECYVRPGKNETGEIMLLSQYYNVSGSRRAALRDAIFQYVGSGVRVSPKLIKSAFATVPPGELDLALRTLVKKNRLMLGEKGYARAA